MSGGGGGSSGGGCGNIGRICENSILDVIIVVDVVMKVVTAK